MITAVSALRQAIPYLRLYRGQTFVVKLGGEAAADRPALVSMLEQVAVLHQLGIRVVLVHGGGPQGTSLAERLGAESKFVEGRRVTDEGMLESIILALNGETRTEILARCSALNIPAIGISGIDSRLILASKRPARQGVDFGFVGDLGEVNEKPILDLLADGYLPVVSPICCDEDGQILNVNADSVASTLAVSLGAAKLVLVTKARGILASPPDEQSLISQIDLEALKQLEANGTLSQGMLPKASSIAHALDGGVERVHVISYQYPDSLLTEVFTNEGCGTLISSDHHAGGQQAE